MNDRSAYPVHADLLAQVADSEAEEREVRRILAPLTDAELSARNAARLGDVESAVAAYKRAPWPIAPANHAHRYARRRHWQMPAIVDLLTSNLSASAE
jgi:hypothetical protein